MKKIVSLILALVLAFSMVATAFAEGEFVGSTITAKDPVIYIGGDSGVIEYDNGEKTFDIDRIGELFDSAGDSNIKDAVINILQPFLIEGMLFDKWDNYYAALEKEIGELFEPIAMDENGDPKEGTGVEASLRKTMENTLKSNRVEKDGGYREKSYTFSYDWRIDPMEAADQLHEYIEGVKKITKHDKVNLSLRCLGSNVALAYAVKYGTESLNGIAFDVSTSLGSEFVGGMISGDFGLDFFAISRFLYDMNLYDDAGIDRFIMASIELLASSGVTNLTVEALRKAVYERIEKGVISALGTSTFLTMPCYWGIVPAEQFDAAVNNVFGDVGSEKREKYAGLIERITTFNEEIKKNVYPIMQNIYDDGVHMAIIAKYGTQLVPVLNDGSILGDFYVSAARSSFGATTSTLYDTLSDEYIAERTALGYGKYISPDKQIDASTCLFPDITWFFKGVQHGYYTVQECNLMMEVLNADEQLTIDDFDWTQFIVYDYATHIAEPMTEENCNNLPWTADGSVERPQTAAEKLRAYIMKLVNWFIALFQFFGSKF